MRDYIHLQHRAKRDLYGLLLGRVIDRETPWTMQPARRILKSRDRFSSVFRLHLGGFGLLYIHAKHLPYYDRRLPHVPGTIDREDF